MFNEHCSWRPKLSKMFIFLLPLLFREPKETSSNLELCEKFEAEIYPFSFFSISAPALDSSKGLVVDNEEAQTALRVFRGNGVKIAQTGGDRLLSATRSLTASKWLALS